MRTVSIISITLVIIAVGIAVIIFFLSPKVTTITDKEKKAAFTKLLGREPILTEKIRSNAFVQYTNTYMTFSYPAAAKKYFSAEKSNTNSGIFERFQFQETNPEYHFFVQVETQPLPYEEVSGIRLRRAQKNIYTESFLSSSIGNWPTFIKIDDMFEKTAFLLHDGKLFTFSLTGSDSAIEKIFDKVVSSVSIQ